MTAAAATGIGAAVVAVGVGVTFLWQNNWERSKTLKEFSAHLSQYII
jgi:hypothetical protein